jgi:hypothetical protein
MSAMRVQLLRVMALVQGLLCPLFASHLVAESACCTFGIVEYAHIQSAAV